VVYGTISHDRQGVWRELASRITRFALQKAMGVDIARPVSAFRAIDSRVRAAFANYQSPYVSFDVLLTWGHKTLRLRASASGGSSCRTVHIYVPQAPQTQLDDDDGVPHIAAANGQPAWFRDDGAGSVHIAPCCHSLHYRGRQGAWLSVSGFDHRHFLQRADVCTRDHGRISGANAFPHDGTPGARGFGKHGCGIRAGRIAPTVRRRCDWSRWVSSTRARCSAGCSVPISPGTSSFVGYRPWKKLGPGLSAHDPTTPHARSPFVSGANTSGTRCWI
jgi:hypothetical protein